MSFEESTERWQRLRHGGHEASGLEIPTLDTGVSTGFGTVRWALGTSGEPRLLLPLRQSEMVRDLEVSDSLRISTATYHLAGNPIRFLDVSCTATTLEAVFGEVADEIIRRIRAGEIALAACRTTLDDFRTLLTDTSPDIAREKITGLVGELIVLRQLLMLDSRAWLLWRGPLMERHDFSGDLLSLEVKTTSRVSSRSVRIAAIDQLQEPAGGELVLCLCLLEPVSGGDLSIFGLVSEVLQLASEPLKVRQLLAGMECPDPEAAEWNRLQFRFEGQVAYSVESGFPRIVPSTLIGGKLPAGLDDVSYSLDLTSASAFEIGEERFASHLGRMIRCLQ